MKKVSIIVPVYNIAQYIEMCYKSVANQTYGNWELILINDGSTDNSLEVCQSIKATDKRVKVITGENKGVSHARNEGINNCTGDYITFIDGDDYIESNTLKEMVKNIEKNKSDMCFAKYYFKDDKKIKSSLIDFDSMESSVLLKHHLSFEFISSLCFCMYKKECLKGIKLVEKIKSHEDWEFLFQIIQNCSKITCCDGCFYHYITRCGSASKSKLNRNKMTAFYVASEIQNKVSDKKELKSYVELIEIHILLKLIVIYSNSGTENKEYKKRLCEIARKNLKTALNSKILAKKHKIYVLLIAINPNIFKFLFNIKNGV